MKQNHPTPGWKGKGIPAPRGGPETGPAPACRTGRNSLPYCVIQAGDSLIEETRIRDGTGAVNSDSPIEETRIRDGTEIHIPVCRTGRRDGTELHIRDSSTNAAFQIPEGLHMYSPNLQGLRNLEGLKSRSRAREPAGHPPEKVCRSRTGMERARNGTRVFSTAHSNPAGLHVYRKGKHVLNAIPGVEQQSAPHYFYKHLMPAWSAGRPLESGLAAYIAVGFPEGMAMPNQRNMPCFMPVYIAVGFSQRNRHTHTSPGLQPHQEEMWLKPKELVCSFLIRQLKQTAIEKQIPAGLHVYRKRKHGLNAAPGVEQLFTPWYFYKYSMPAWSTDRPPASALAANIAVGFPEGMAMPSQRNRHTHISTGLQPHQEKMWLKPDLPRFILIRQLKQTAIQGTSNAVRQIPEGLHVYSQTVSRENTRGVIRTCQRAELLFIPLGTTSTKTKSKKIDNE
ncbi:hypothetical protein SAMN05444280_11386 [Tangfeifania diversioriginum]|uniref:Uncharacterized protein n=1 Tax=Tangfeifania diversioriginum TaxID=1168035 RepID=A0A1M6HH39_9BACT|nr:hypothetical protein [Tangfeifania diversioriginum]SHJ21471.1 hypothetical protein SAMN05444280_11386 [Tangfeifania diversioriginum]